MKCGIFLNARYSRYSTRDIFRTCVIGFTVGVKEDEIGRCRKNMDYSPIRSDREDLTVVEFDKDLPIFIFGAVTYRDVGRARLTLVKNLMAHYVFLL